MVGVDSVHDLVEVPLAVLAVLKVRIFAERARVLGEVDDLPVVRLGLGEEGGDELA